MTTSIDVALVTRDTQRAVGFYRDLLGLEPAGDLRVGGIVPDGHLTRLGAGESVLKILEFDERGQGTGQLASIGASAGLQYFTVRVDDPAAVTQRHAEGGGEVLVEARELRPGVTVAFLRDPDGNIVELVAGA